MIRLMTMFEITGSVLKIKSPERKRSCITEATEVTTLAPVFRK